MITGEDRLKMLVEAGWNPQVAESLAAKGFVPQSARHLSHFEAFNLFLEWNGILGSTQEVIDALDNCRNMEAL